jgi:hypothetical protein
MSVIEGGELPNYRLLFFIVDASVGGDDICKLE